MGFDVVQQDAARVGEAGKCADLIEHKGVDLLGSKSHVTASEALEVGVAGVRPHRHARLGGPPHRCGHGHRVARMEAAGHVHARYQGYDLVVEAERIAAEPLSEVAVEVYGRWMSRHAVLLKGENAMRPRRRVPLGRCCGGADVPGC